MSFFRVLVDFEVPAASWAEARELVESLLKTLVVPAPVSSGTAPLMWETRTGTPVFYEDGTPTPVQPLVGWPD